MGSTEPRRIAVVDLDGTLVKDRLSRLCAFVGRGDDDRRLRDRPRGGDPIQPLLDRYNLLIGVRQEIVKNAFDLEPEKNTVIFPGAPELISHLHERGYYVLAASGSPAFVLAHYQPALGYDEFIGAPIRVSNGEIAGAFREDFVVDGSDAFKCRSVVARIGALGGSLGSTLAFGDSMSDEALWRLVGPDNSYAMSPGSRVDRSLLREDHIVTDLRELPSLIDAGLGIAPTTVAEGITR